jgi:hypothetical protein
MILGGTSTAQALLIWEPMDFVSGAIGSRNVVDDS